MIGKFGMCEMERAAEAIARKLGGNLEVGAVVFCEDMQDHDGSLTGFVELLDNGWLTSADPLRRDRHRYNGQFYLTAGFVERMTGQAPAVAAVLPSD